MIKKIKYLLGIEDSQDKKFIKYLLSLEKETPNNYQFGSLMRQKIRDYKLGNIEFKKNNKIFSH